MFKWLNKQGVESDKGFIVQTVGRFTIEYRQHQRIISLQIETDYEPSQDKVIIIVSKNSFVCWDNNEKISNDEQTIIRKNFVDAMEFQGIKVILED